MVDFVVLAVEQSFMSLMKNRSVGEFPLKREKKKDPSCSRRHDKIAKNKLPNFPPTKLVFLWTLQSFRDVAKKTVTILELVVISASRIITPVCQRIPKPIVTIMLRI